MGTRRAKGKIHRGGHWLLEMYKGAPHLQTREALPCRHHRCRDQVIGLFFAPHGTCDHMDQVQGLCTGHAQATVVRGGAPLRMLVKFLYGEGDTA